MKLLLQITAAYFSMYGKNVQNKFDCWDFDNGSVVSKIFYECGNSNPWLGLMRHAVFADQIYQIGKIMTSVESMIYVCYFKHEDLLLSHKWYVLFKLLECAIIFSHIGSRYINKRWFWKWHFCSGQMTILIVLATQLEYDTGIRRTGPVTPTRNAIMLLLDLR